MSKQNTCIYKKSVSLLLLPKNFIVDMISNAFFVWVSASSFHMDTKRTAYLVIIRLSDNKKRAVSFAIFKQEDRIHKTNSSVFRFVFALYTEQIPDTKRPESCSLRIQYRQPSVAFMSVLFTGQILNMILCVTDRKRVRENVGVLFRSLYGTDFGHVSVHYRHKAYRIVSVLQTEQN